MSKTSATTTTSMGNRGTQNSIKPSDVYDLRCKTSHIQLQTRQLRTQLNRLQDQIQFRTNAINKTFEEESDKPPVITNHSNSVPQLSRSMQSAQNTLATLNEQIDATVQDDKTFVVKELEEEVRLVYCEHQRLAMLLQDAKIEANSSSSRRKEAEERVSNPHIKDLKTKNNDLQAENASLRDKAFAYEQKQKKLQIDQTVADHINNNVPSSNSISEAENKTKEAQDKLAELAQQLNEDKENHKKQIEELTEILEGQKLIIQDFLDGKIQPDPKEENEDGKNDEAKNEEERDAAE